MPKGGHAYSGPAKDPNALARRRDGADWIHLPRSGRKGETPRFPLTASTHRERTLWASVWRLPQAIQWEANEQFVEVALYVRSLADAEQRDASVAARTLVRQFQEGLGISLPGMNRLRWIIDDDTASTSSPTANKPEAGDDTSSRVRTRVIEVMDGGLA